MRNCGRSSTSSFVNSARMCVFTPGTDRFSSAAISRLLAGTAPRSVRASGRHSATSTRRSAAVTIGARVATADAVVSLTALGERNRSGRRADAHDVAVVEPPPAQDPLAVHERAVARQPLVDQRPVAAEELELRVRA